MKYLIALMLSLILAFLSIILWTINKPQQQNLLTSTVDSSCEAPTEPTRQQSIETPSMPDLPDLQSSFTQLFGSDDTDLTNDLLEFKEMLEEKYGSSVDENPIYAHLVSPLGPEFRFLDFEEQLLVLRVKDDADSELATLNPGVPTELSSIRKLRSRLQNDLSDLVGEAKARQIMMRSSAIGQQLLGTIQPMQLDEQSLLDLYDKLEQLPPKRVDAFLKGRGEASLGYFADSVKDVMGPQNYETFVRVKDPLYQAIYKFAQKDEDTSPRAVDESYDVIVSMFSQIDEVRAEDLTSEDKQYRVSEIRKSAEYELQSVLGAATGRELWRNSAQLTLQYRTDSQCL